jgi:hypothetical protein
MMKKQLGVFLLLVSAGCGTGLGELKEFSSAEGGFKVKMPGSPKKQSQPAAGTTLHTYSVEGRSGAMIASYGDMPIPAKEPEAKIQDRLDGARQGMLKNVNATLVKETKIQLPGGHPGREITADLPAGKGIMRARIFLVDTRLYQILVVGVPTFANSTDATTFLESFELKK